MARTEFLFLFLVLLILVRHHALLFQKYQTHNAVDRIWRVILAAVKVAYAQFALEADSQHLDAGHSGDHLPGQPLALTIWLRAMWQITRQKNGIGALGLQRVLGLGSHMTDWAMLHNFS
jgi:hypothetical protein